MIDDEEDMITNVVDPLILEIYLYKSNYKDRLLISALKEKAYMVRMSDIEENDDSFFVRVEDVHYILRENFRKDIKQFESTPEKSLSNLVTSIYFIDSMIKSFGMLKYFKVNVSKSEVYTRKTKDVISFEFKVIHSRLHLPSFCTEEFLEKCQDIFRKVGFYKRDKFDKSPYFETTAVEFIDKLIQYTHNVNEEEAVYVDNILSILGSKIEKDNPVLLIIVED
jgi:hypothetical protein